MFRFETSASTRLRGRRRRGGGDSQGESQPREGITIHKHNTRHHDEEKAASGRVHRATLTDRSLLVGGEETGQRIAAGRQGLLEGGGGMGQEGLHKAERGWYSLWRRCSPGVEVVPLPGEEGLVPGVGACGGQRILSLCFSLKDIHSGRRISLEGKDSKQQRLVRVK